MEFKIVYYQGEAFDLKTKFESGKAITSNDSLLIKGKTDIQIQGKSIQTVDMAVLKGLGRIIKIVTTNGQTLFVVVVRLNIAGYFVIGNFFGTGKLYRFLTDLRLKS